MKTDFSQYVLPTNDPGWLSFLSPWCQQAATRKPRLPKFPRALEEAPPPDSQSCPSSSCFTFQSVTHSFHLRAAAALHSDTTSAAPSSPNPGFFFRVSRLRPGARREATPDGPILSVQDAPPAPSKALSGDRGSAEALRPAQT